MMYSIIYMFKLKLCLLQMPLSIARHLKIFSCVIKNPQKTKITIAFLLALTFVPVVWRNMNI